MGHMVGCPHSAYHFFLGPDFQIHLYRLLIAMSRRSVVQAMIVALAMVAAADVLIRRMASNSMPRQVMRTIASSPPVIDVLGIGNSLMVAGFDPDAVEQIFRDAGRPCAAVNGGLGATGVIEHLALTRLALSHHNVKTVIYGFFDQQMSADLAGRNSDLIGNRSMLYYQEPQLTLRYARFDLFDRLSFQVCRSSALLRERSTIWTRVEGLRRMMGSVGMPPQETNSFGRRADFALLEAPDTHIFVEACQKVIQAGDFLAAPVQEMLREAREHGAKVIVVEMPMHPDHVRRFYSEPVWRTFRARTRAAVESAGAAYLDASAWIPDGHLFADPLHLSKEGGIQFSRLLARRLID